MHSRKSEFSLPSHVHYLNAAYMGPISRAVEAAGVTGVRLKNFPVQIPVRDFFGPKEKLRTAFARLVNTDAERVALIPAIGYGMAMIANHLTVKPGQNVVVPAEEFPSNVYALREKCRRQGAELRMVPRPTETSNDARNNLRNDARNNRQNVALRWTEEIIAAIDAETALVGLSSVHWTDGTCFRLARIAARAREVGALFAIDSTQSLGVLPFDFEEIAPDALLGVGYKFLLGPYTMGCMALSDRLLEAVPLEFNWLNRPGSEDFSQVMHYQDDFKSGARRHDFGQHASPILVPMLETSIRQLIDWDVTATAAHCRALFEELAESLAGTSYLLSADPEQAGHLFGIRLTGNPDLKRLAAKLEEERVYVSIRGNSLRVSTHVFNDAEDIRALSRVLRTLDR